MEWEGFRLMQRGLCGGGGVYDEWEGFTGSGRGLG